MNADHDSSDGIRECALDVGPRTLRLLEAGPPDGSPVLFLHGWPECADSWTAVLQLAAADGYRAVAYDQPGISGSTGDPTDGSTAALAQVVEDVLSALELTEVTLVGHDLGGMIAYPCLRRSERLARVVIMNVVVPGLPPWQEVLANPYVWHFAFHSIPGLPETLVQGRQRAYVDFFFDVMAPEGGSGVSAASRDRCAAAYGTDRQLSTGFSWYRQFPADAADNTSITGTTDRPLLYLRGDHEGGEVADYVAGFQQAGVSDVTGDVIASAGHFAPEDAPEAVWTRIRAFIDRTAHSESVTPG